MTSQTARAATPHPPILQRGMHGSIALLTLNRPQARNSLSEGLIAELHAALTEIGNTFRIRHAETTQEMLTDPAQIDYLFHRMFSFVRFVLKGTGRGWIA